MDTLDRNAATEPARGTRIASLGARALTLALAIAVALLAAKGHRVSDGLFDGPG